MVCFIRLRVCVYMRQVGADVEEEDMLKAKAAL